ncbi:DUF397 domain-containing protein [Streptomyces sp. A1499]|uniref:DUF397 domain-containing protein n=1 Tax=Streptomyces sp. A1499 TaxID=2563104 RepID=UPI00109E92FE|nr:DUF397 domain-containing protein [Streptomyces sp. A1499]THC53997.1 DUF397 domain-containing protein [Streptomyces sp. A1499]
MTLKPAAGNASELEWIKSSYSDSSDINDCVEIAATPGTVHVRDSKRARGPRLTVTPTAWADFITYASLD